MSQAYSSKNYTNERFNGQLVLFIDISQVTRTEITTRTL